MKPILVTGAAGNVGATGRHLVNMLLSRGAPVRAMVRKIDDRSESLKAKGAEIVVADFLNEESIRNAMKDVGVAYFCAPVFDSLLEATAVFALSAKDNGVSRIINVSQMGTKDPILSPATRMHRLSEMVFEWSGVPTSHLRATVYLEQLTQVLGGAIRQRNAIVAPFDDQKASMIAGVDVAKVAAAIALNPERFGPGPYHLTGAENFTFAEAAKTLTKVLGREITYINLDPPAWHRALLERGVPPHLAAHLDKLYEKGRLGRLDHQKTDDVERVGGSPPVTLEEFVVSARASFT